MPDVLATYDENVQQGILITIKFQFTLLQYYSIAKCRLVLRKVS